MQRLLALAFLLAVAGPAAGQDRITVEMTPLIGLRAGGRLQSAITGEKFSIEPSWSWGFVAGFAPWSPHLVLEGTYLQQLTRASGNDTFGGAFGGLHDMRLQTGSIGLQWNFSPQASLRPFVALGVGATSIDASGGGRATSFTMTLAGGVKVMMSRNFGLRFDVRALALFSTFTSEELCHYSECLVEFPGRGTAQVDVALGTMFTF